MKKIIFKLVCNILKTYATKAVERNNPKIIAITGSVGKTSTKEAVFQVLKDRFGDDVGKNYGNMNSEIGLPLAILGYEEIPNKILWPFVLLAARFKIFRKDFPKYFVLEMGVDKPKDIAYLTQIAQPDFAIITSTSGAHLSNFDQVEGYQKEKLSMINHMKEGGQAILNYDDKFLKEVKGANIHSIGIKEARANYKGESISVSLKGTDYRVSSTGHKIAVRTKLLGQQAVYSQLFAIAMADLLGISLLSACKSLEKLKPISGRMNIIEGKNNMVIIDDTYNSNPSSVKTALDVLKDIDYSFRKVAILGNMNELGRYEKEAHEEIANYAKAKCDLVVFIGKNADVMKVSYGDSKSSLSFKDRNEFLGKADDILRENDLILVKASQNKNFFEEIVKKIMAKPEDAPSLLVRQGPEWFGKKL